VWRAKSLSTSRWPLSLNPLILAVTIESSDVRISDQTLGVRRVGLEGDGGIGLGMWGGEGRGGSSRENMFCVFENAVWWWGKAAVPLHTVRGAKGQCRDRSRDKQHHVVFLIAQIVCLEMGQRVQGLVRLDHAHLCNEFMPYRRVK
jgi:hypothetical protein